MELRNKAQMSRQFLSPQYTKKLKDLPKIQC
ncbi:DUF4113 domain-containing protein [Vibrio splendidus]